MHEAKFYKKLKPPLSPLLRKEGNLQTVACELCCHFCRINNEGVGICGVRKNINGKLISLVYGHPAAMNIDPIEKKPLFHFLPGSSAFSLGTLGCNFRCDNCQNWEISQIFSSPLTRGDKGGLYSINKTPSSSPLSGGELSPREIVDQALASGCRSIAYTYNEPTVFAEYALDIMKIAKKNNLKNVWVSNGYMSQICLEAILPYLDAANIDLKSMDEKFYIKNCGAKLQPILKNLIALRKAGVHLEITTLVIPKLSDDPAMLKQAAKFIAHELGDEVPWHLSRFSPEVSWKLKTTPETDEEAIFRAYEIGKQAGLKYVYVGNVSGTDKENTYCPACGQLAIKRLGYDITRHDNNGRCAKCGKDLNILPLTRGSYRHHIPRLD